MNAVTTSGLQEAREERGKANGRTGEVCGQRGRNVTVALAISPINGLVFHSAIIGGMNAERFSEFLAQARLNLEPNEHVVFIYDGAPAHRRPNQLGPNTELKMLPPYSPFLNIVEHRRSAR